MDKNPVILLFGANGQVGWELRRTLSTLGQVTSAGIDGADQHVDFTDLDSISQLVEAVKPALMVNAAAYTAVDKAESEPELAQQVNADAVGHIGRLAAAIDCPVVHYSTDYVFSGEGNTPWREQDEPDPRSVYGHTKLRGEQALANSGADFIILRTAWVYGARGANFMLTMQRLFREKDQLNIVADQYGAPTWSRHIAEATAQILAQSRASQEQGFNFSRSRGIYHLTAAGQASWHEFAEAILAGTDADCQLIPITTEEYPCSAARPGFSVLNNEHLRRVFGVGLPHWHQGLALCLDE
jgi:dTDP-4-dehydrorhamnose reductase